MATIKHKEFNAEMRMKAIELLNSSLVLPADPSIPITNFNFNINVENNVDAATKVVFAIVHIEIKGDKQTDLLGAISVSCIFEILNFDDVIKVNKQGLVDIPEQLLQTINLVSLSTTRGVMFSTYKGTFLHSAVLPIIDPKQLQFEQRTNVTKKKR